MNSNGLFDDKVSFTRKHDDLADSPLFCADHFLSWLYIKKLFVKSTNIHSMSCIAKFEIKAAYSKGD